MVVVVVMMMMMMVMIMIGRCADLHSVDLHLFFQGHAGGRGKGLYWFCSLIRLVVVTRSADIYICFRMEKKMMILSLPVIKEVCSRLMNIRLRI